MTISISMSNIFLNCYKKKEKFKTEENKMHNNYILCIS